MSLYINHENQRILWESIQQHPSIDLIHQDNRNDWFKNIVKDVYETIPRPWFHRKITTEELNLLNQSTIRRMLGDLKPPVATLPPSELVEQRLTSLVAPWPNQTSQLASVPTRHVSSLPQFSYNEASMDVGIKSAHTPMIQQRYLEKQQELESMLRQPNPTTPVDFKMSTLDEPITNMEELLQKHAREREQDLALDPNFSVGRATYEVSSEEATRSVCPLPNSSGDRRSPSELVEQRLSAPWPNASTSLPTSSSNNIKINITEEPVTISIIDLVSDLPSPVIKKASALKKQISFQEDITPSHIENDKGIQGTEALMHEFTYQIPEHVLLEQKILKLEQEMAVLKKLIFGIYKGMSVCPLQTLLLETSGKGATRDVSHYSTNSEGDLRSPDEFDIEIS